MDPTTITNTNPMAHMDLSTSLIWMFFGSIFIGIFLDGMNILAFRLNDIYYSNELILMALFMASNMCITEVAMYSYYSNNIEYISFFLFIIFSLIIAYVLREQITINDEQWLRRMIGHHSVAVTTSHKILEKAKNDKVKTLAGSIIANQEKEIALMKQILSDDFKV